jgi:hypothetical protein
MGYIQLIGGNHLRNIWYTRTVIQRKTNYALTLWLYCAKMYVLISKIRGIMRENKNKNTIWSRTIATAIAGLFLCLIFVPTQSAYAEWDPSYVMREDTFLGSGSMSEQQVQDFLVSKGGFLASYTLPADILIGPNNTDLMPAGTTAAHVIWQASQWYGVNPQLILVTLQKEQSGVTSPVATLSNTDCAMGYDSGGGCQHMYDEHPTWRGFARQVDMGTWQLRYNFERSGGNDSYYSYLNYTSYMVGGSLSGVSIRTRSAASLYSYTPNINTYGPGYSFRINYISWFGNLLDDPGITPVYRFYKASDSTHFYTASEAEKINILLKWPTIYKYEGVAYNLNNASGKNNTPLYRFYNKKTSTHFFTASEAEKNNVITKWGYIYQYEGVAYNVASDTVGTAPVYRFWNVNGTHFYTISEAERNNVIARWPNIFKYEGIGYYVSN